MTKTHSLLTLMLLVTAVGCAEETAAEEELGDSAAEMTAPAQRSGDGALPISGEWALVHWKGHVSTNMGSLSERHPIDRTFDASEKNGLVTFDLDSEGAGSLEGSGRCTPQWRDATGGPPATTIAAAYALIVAIRGLVETARCVPDRLVSQTMRAVPRRSFFGQPDNRLAANLGVYGETASATAADLECRALRGPRWISFDGGALACIGYADAKAKTLKMLLQRAGDIHVQRLLMRRPGGDS